MDKFDKHIINLFESDAANFQPDDIVHDKLIKHFNQKSLQGKVYQNNFIQPILHLFSSKFLAIKIGVAAACIIGFMGVKQMNQNRPYLIHCDSIQTNYSIDTVKKAFMFNDTVIP